MGETCSWCGKKLGEKDYKTEPMTSPHRAYGHTGYYRCPTCNRGTFPKQDRMTLDNYFDLSFDGR